MSEIIIPAPAGSFVLSYEYGDEDDPGPHQIQRPIVAVVIAGNRVHYAIGTTGGEAYPIGDVGQGIVQWGEVR